MVSSRCRSNQSADHVLLQSEPGLKGACPRGASSACTRYSESVIGWEVVASALGCGKREVALGVGFGSSRAQSDGQLAILEVESSASCPRRGRSSYRWGCTPNVDDSGDTLEIVYGWID